MPRVFQVWQGKELNDHRGNLIAGSGERVPFDHPAVLAHKDPAQVGCFIEVDAPEPTPPESLEWKPEAAPSEATTSVDEESRPARRWGRTD